MQAEAHVTMLAPGAHTLTLPTRVLCLGGKPPIALILLWGWCIESARRVGQRGCVATLLGFAQLALMSHTFRSG